MIEGVLQVSETHVRDVMIPRSQMDVLDVAESPEKFIPFVIETAHSRFPVYEDNRDNVIGILLAKDLLRFYAEEEFNVREMLRPAVFVPESKRLNVLLKEFRANRNHIAIVVDEYGGVAGLVTIEDVIEQIVGDIEDEYDFDETEDNIIADRSGRFRVKAVTEIADFNSHFESDFSDADYDTVGGPRGGPLRAPAQARRVDRGRRVHRSRCCARTAARSTRCWSKNRPSRPRRPRAPRRRSRVDRHSPPAAGESLGGADPRARARIAAPRGHGMRLRFCAVLRVARADRHARGPLPRLRDERHAAARGTLGLRLRARLLPRRHFLDLREPARVRRDARALAA
jgi:CBS domain-containing protein